MSMFGRLFRPPKRATLDPESRQWFLQAYNVIKMAVGMKLAAEYRQSYDEDRALTVAAAVANKLFGSPSPAHHPEVLELADRIAEKLLRTDDEIRYAAVMGCRAYLLCKAGEDTNERWVIWDTIQWIASVCPLPPDEADPVTIGNLANTLHARYMKKA
jgi:hypothetical protein